ncbi:hypothetical protein LCGC14_1004890 [marine sediment metagenome]|uniref:UmuC domain-containing protein n=1 Tax=marine sediment metagenome TaxID=412755 RepID=A0A0F9N6K3_9ZZZZ
MIQSTRGQAQGVERLYLDFDSFFASAEQHFNADLRGRPLGVVPLDSPHTGCIAVSRQAKALGVKPGTTVKQAREIIPDMIFVVARHDVHVRLHKRILEVIAPSFRYRKFVPSTKWCATCCRTKPARVLYYLSE